MVDDRAAGTLNPQAAANGFVEARPQPAIGGVGSAAVEQVFISPRVVDREAFNDFSMSLRKLIEGAATQTESLRLATDQAKLTTEALRDMAQRQQARFDAASKSLALIETRVLESEKLAASATLLRQQVEEQQRQIQQAGLQQLEAINTRTAELLDRLEAAQRSGEEALRRSESLSTEALMNIVGAAERKLAQVEAKLIEFKPRSTPEPRFTPPSAVTASPVTPAIVQNGAPNAVEITSEQRAAIEKLAQRAEALTQQLRSAVAAAEQVSKTSEGKIDQLQQRVHEASVSHNQLTITLREAGTTSTQLESLQGQARQAKSMLMDAINAAAARIDELLEQAGSATQSAEQVAPLLQQTQTRTQESLRELRATAQTAQSIASQSQELMGRLTQLVDQLRPWEGMLDQTATGELPAPLAAMVEQARKQVASEASLVAGALREAAVRMSGRS
jgi:uncharacterized phage infection (PIP) family protein YhgE